jgi:hypothetical protein
VTQRAVNVLPLEYPDPVVSVEQDVEIDGKDIITSFAWHPIEENCLVNIFGLFFFSLALDFFIFKENQQKLYFTSFFPFFLFR